MTERGQVVWVLLWALKIVGCLVAGVAGGHMIKYAFAMFDTPITSESVKYVSAILGLAFIVITIGAANREESDGGKAS